MNEKTLEALKGSIAKWEAIAAGHGEDNGAENCPLCILFQDCESEKFPACAGCPVSESTRLTYCRGTPYDNAWSEATAEQTKNPIKAITEEQKLAAQQELNFLKSLLPKDAK